MALYVLALLLCRLVVAAAAGQVLAVTVSGLDCTAPGSQGSHPPRPAGTTTCTLHACTTTSADSHCQLQRMPQLLFAPCDQGAVLISTRDIMQHLQAAAEAAEAAHEDIYDADSQPLADHSLLEGNSTASVSLLQLAAACTRTETTPTMVNPTPVWSHTSTLDLSPDDRSQIGLADQHRQPFTTLQLPAPAEPSGNPATDAWSAAAPDLEQLLLVDLLLMPAAPELPTSSGVVASTAGGSHEQEDDAMPDQLEVQQQSQLGSTCTASWHVWLARAGMVVFVGGLQLLQITFGQRASRPL